LSRLERDGWVRVLPQNGTYVREFSAAEIAAMSELRLLLEAHAASVAAMQVSHDDLATLRERFETLKARGAGKNFDEFLALDDLFHGMVYRVAGNPFISNILQNLRDQIHWVRITNASLPGRVEESLQEMDRVLRAMERRDATGAAEAMRQHIGNIALSFGAAPVGQARSADAA
jgi:DNA-binding GntR family transcriptional regulator